MPEFDGKVAIVTGAGAGIGRASALAFSRQGAAVVVADIDEEAAAHTVELIASESGEGLAVHCDVADEASVMYMVARTVERYGRLDVAHNNAGIDYPRSPLAALSKTDWDRLIAVNLTGVWLCMKYEIPAMLRQGGGAIVNTASGAGLTGFAGTHGYTPAKHGVVGLTKTGALDYAAQNIRVNVICPGTTRTTLLDEMFGDRLDAFVAKLTPLGRVAEPDEVAAAAVWLCSSASSYVTGAVLSVDGGLLAGIRS